MFGFGVLRRIKAESGGLPASERHVRATDTWYTRAAVLYTTLPRCCSYHVPRIEGHRERGLGDRVVDLEVDRKTELALQSPCGSSRPITEILPDCCR